MTTQPLALTVDLEPQLLVLFGGTGDLARSKVLPALFRLESTRSFADRIIVLAVATRQLTDTEYREWAEQAISEAGLEGGEWCQVSLYYQSLKEGFDALATRIAEVESAHELGENRVFYLAVPPHVFVETIDGLGDAGLIKTEGWSRIVIEKPFGGDAASAAVLNTTLLEWFTEDQIFRIDHYLGKETVQNLLALRFANPVFEASWNRDRIAAVQITVSEDFGIGGRGAYFDRAGIVRDIIQNHALQLLSLVAMEPPVRLEPDFIRDEKVKVLRSILPPGRSEIALGQYASYREEASVDAASDTPTFAAVRLFVDTWRWKGVPFYVRSGKRMRKHTTEIVIQFHRPPVALFGPMDLAEFERNVFRVKLQPDEGFELGFQMKTPGEGYELQSKALAYHYREEQVALPTAYETLLVDIMSGDQTLFVRTDEVAEAWRIVEPMLDGVEPAHYADGTDGPSTAEVILEEFQHGWV